MGVYDDVAQSGLKVAGAIAVALFVLRLAIYNWNRLIGDDDDVLHVLGDWLTAGLLAVVAGALLDLINQVGWWMMRSDNWQRVVHCQYFGEWNVWRPVRYSTDCQRSGGQRVNIIHVTGY